jgi:ornithine carbamoyltransferase
MRYFLSLKGFSTGQIKKLLKETKKLKEEGLEGTPLSGKKLAMLFEKPSLRTRVSFELAMTELGGYAFYLSPHEIGLGKREAIKDVAQVLSRYVDAVMVRVFVHSDLLELSEHSEVPVINGLSDLNHPCQGLTDLYTIWEHFGSLKGKTLAYIGDGNNVAYSLVTGGVKTGIEVRVASPKGHEPKLKGAALVTNNPEEAVEGADVVYADTWTSMGQEEEEAERLKRFKNFQVNSRLMKLAKPQAIFMHCLPAHRGQEVTDEVIDSSQSVVYTQAENRLHTQKAILLWVLEKI